MDEKQVTILIRKGLSGYSVAACSENGNFISNFESERALRDNWKREKRYTKIKFIRQLDRWPEDRPPRQTVYGYARVSTKGQASDGTSLDAQETALKAAGATIVYKDVFTGKSLERPELQKLLAVVKGGDTIIVTKLDRFARSVSQASELINELLERRVTVNVLNVGILSNDSVNTLLRNVLLAFAQFERDMIVQRTQEGKVIARQREGFKEGRPRKFTPEQLQHAVELLNDHSYRQVEKMTGISKSTLIREHNKRTGAEK